MMQLPAYDVDWPEDSDHLVCYIACICGEKFPLDGFGKEYSCPHCGVWYRT